MGLNKYFKIWKNEIYPIYRSICGNGVREVLKIIKREFKSLKIKNVKCGSKVYDWVIPSEWEAKDAYVEDKYQNKIINFKKNNLHLISHSIPIKKTLSKEELIKRLHTHNKLDNAIPYITSYYKKNWGFCVTKKFKRNFVKKYNKKDKFKININSKFNPSGNLNYGELFIKGKSSEEILISTYICHPQMANNETSGIIVSMALIHFFNKKKPNKSLRFVFVPETIGSISFLSKNIDHLKKNFLSGYNISCIGDERKHSCILSKYENSPSDNALKYAYKKLKINYKTYSFLLRGSDERQYNSPGIDLPVTTICRSKFDEYKEYHSSLDNFEVVTFKGLKGGYTVVKEAINFLLNNTYPKSRYKCEPQLGKRNLYPNLSNNVYGEYSLKLLDFLQYSDGSNDIKEISEKIKVNSIISNKLYKILKKNKLL